MLYVDVEMLEYAATAVAMGRAPHSVSVQAIANWVAPSLENDGVAIIAEKFLL